MLKALVRKQFLELGSLFMQNRKEGKTRSKTGVVFMALLYVFLFGFLGVVFYFMSNAFLPILLVEPGLYYTLCGIVAVLYGTLGSVFNTYASLYKAKDNEFLLSMPIPPSAILFARLIGAFGMSMLYSAMVWIPAVIFGLQNTFFSVKSLVISILSFLTIGIFVTALTCLLGFLVSLISSKFKKRGWTTALFTVCFLILYYLFFSKIPAFLAKLVTEMDAVLVFVKKWLGLFWLLGTGAEGSALGFFLFLLISVLFLAAAWALLSKTFLRIATTKKNFAEKGAKAGKIRQRSAFRALFSRECRHLFSSSVYLLNCGLGTVFLLLAAVGFIWKAGDIQNLAQMLPDISSVFALAVTFIPCLLATVNDLSAPSVSLEGENLWIVQSLPVPPETVLFSKVALQIVFTLPPTLILTGILAVLFKVPWFFTVPAFLTVAAWCVLQGEAGVFFNLLMPNLSWTNEAVPIKQSAPVAIMMFGGWIVNIALAAAGFFLLGKMPVLLFLALAFLLFAILDVLLYFWLKGAGARRFARL